APYTLTLHDALPILGREVQRPVVTLRKRVAVVVVGVVDAAAGIRVLEPCAPDVVVLLENDELDSGLLQPVRGEETGHAGANDRDMERRLGRDVWRPPAWSAPVLAPHGQLLLQQGKVRGHLRAADRVLPDA